MHFLPSRHRFQQQREEVVANNTLWREPPWQSVTRSEVLPITDETLNSEQGLLAEEDITVALVDRVGKVFLQIQNQVTQQETVTKKDPAAKGKFDDCLGLRAERGGSLGERVGGATWHRGPVGRP